MEEELKDKERWGTLNVTKYEANEMVIRRQKEVGFRLCRTPLLLGQDGM